MKTLLFTLEYPPFHGGVANYYGSLVKHWPEKNNIFVLHNNDNQLINKRFPIIKWLPSFRLLWQSVRENKINHIIVGHILPLGTVAYLFSFFVKIDYSVILHGMDIAMAIKNKRKACLSKKILKRSSNIICNSNYTAGIAIKFLGDNYREKVKIVNPGVDDFQIEHTDLKSKHKLDDKIVLFSLGRLVKRKGFDKTIEALPNILKEIPNLIYVVGGTGEESSSLKNKVTELKLENNVIFLGDISEKEKLSWLDLCDIFIMPARNIDGDLEGFGIVYLEANLAKKPVVAGDSGGVSDAVVNGLNGLLVDPVDINDISLTTIKLAKDKALRERLGTQGRQRALKEFGWQKQVEKINNILSNKK